MVSFYFFFFISFSHRHSFLTPPSPLRSSSNEFCRGLQNFRLHIATYTSRIRTSIRGRISNIAHCPNKIRMAGRKGEEAMFSLLKKKKSCTIVRATRQDYIYINISWLYLDGSTISIVNRLWIRTGIRTLRALKNHAVLFKNRSYWIKLTTAGFQDKIDARFYYVRAHLRSMPNTLITLIGRDN